MAQLTASALMLAGLMPATAAMAQSSTTKETQAPPAPRPYPPARYEPVSPSPRPISPPPSPNMVTPPDKGDGKVTFDPDQPYPKYKQLQGYPAIPQPSVQIGKEPALPGQKLIDWARPSVLEYEIPEQWRGMKIACGETDYFYLDEAIATCEPLLNLTKLSLQLQFAVEDARRFYAKDTIRAEASRAESLAFADAIIKAHGTPEWPLHYRLLADSYKSRAQLYEKWGEYDKAIADTDAQIPLFQAIARYDRPSPSPESDFTSSTYIMRAYAKKAELLLAKKDRPAAIAYYEMAYANKADKDLFVSFSPIRQLTEMMVQDAVFARDYDRALQWIDRYFKDYSDHAAQYGQSSDFSGEILQKKLISYKIYILADREQKDAVRDTLTLYERAALGDQERSRRPFCSNSELFPAAITPYHKDPDIRARLHKLGCKDAQLDTLDTVPAQGFKIGITMQLPPHQ